MFALPLLVLIGSPLPQPPKAIAVPAELTGTWTIVEVERDGKKSDADKNGNVPASMTIKGDAVTIESAVPFVFVTTVTGTIKVVGVEKKALRVDLKYKAVISARDGEKVSEGTVEGLWEIVDKNTLRMCRADGDARPTGFETKEGDGKIVYILKRVKE